MSAFDPGGAPNGFHFQAQLSSGEIVVEEYYNQNNSGFGAYIKLPRPGYNPFLAYAPDYNFDYSTGKFPPGQDSNLRGPHVNGGEQTHYPAFGPADMNSSPGGAQTYDNGKSALSHAVHAVARFPSRRSRTVSKVGRSIIRGDKNSPAVGKFTPLEAPANHMLTLFARTGQPSVQLSAGTGWHLPDQEWQSLEPSENAANQERSQLQRMLAAAVVPYSASTAWMSRQLPLANDGKLEGTVGRNPSVFFTSSF